MDEVAALHDFLSGFTAMGYLMAALFFLRFWKGTRDRLFAIFALAFGILALQRFGLTVTGEASERGNPFYLLRLLAFVLILIAIVDKNRSRPER